ncbi:uncharacterized protein L201_002076 [Kwoniella dendrophila CBS 6074]|uniref:RNA helicase n=1 Tax=Kwoniella dendrophila CBS 6074 TaxID=1295534 RepID=A0AAX4JP65_9TREE
MQVESETPDWADQNATEQSSSHRAKGPGSQWQALNVGQDLIKSLLMRKFKTPTPIQRASIPGALSAPPRDILAMARTGSGKTLAYLIPLLERLGSTHSLTGNPRALIMCPSRELAVQILSVGKDLARGMVKGKGKDRENLKWALIMGGESMEGQFEKMSGNPDILFEMGFDVQLREILSRLPSTRQNLLFSATLPSSVAEFAKAGLVNPLLIRLDTEHKISPDLDIRFLSVKPTEKDAGLLILLRDAIKINNQDAGNQDRPQAIVFVSTKHHVDYVSELLKAAGYRISHIYSSLDQSARQQQMHHFRKRFTDVLVVTDVAARGLDIPVMDHVINYDFPPGPRVFVHRVGRTARAGRKGTAWSLVTRDDWPYLFDLQTFLGFTRIGEDADILKTFPQDNVSEQMEFIIQGLDEEAPHLVAQREVMRKGQAMFERSRGKASPNSYRKAKLLGQSLGGRPSSFPVDSSLCSSTFTPNIEARERLVASLAAYAPSETIFELGRRGETENSQLMQKRRKLIAGRKNAVKADNLAPKDEDEAVLGKESTAQTKSFRDPSFFMSHTKIGAAAEEGYSLRSGASLPEAISASTLDMTADEGSAARAQKASQLSWDRKKRKFVQSTVGADNKKMIRSESGALLPASYSSGRYTAWKQKRRIVNPPHSTSDSQDRAHDRTKKSANSRGEILSMSGVRREHGSGSSLFSAPKIRQQRLDKQMRISRTGRSSKKSRRT